jgi:integrase/recombinase XerC
MGTVRLPHCTDVDWLTVGPIAPHACAIKQHFAEDRYALSTVARYLSNIAHFARWARVKRLRLCRIDEASVTEFQHLPHCRCEGPVRHDRCDHRTALGHFLFVLRARGVVTLPAKSTTPVDEELWRFDAYMDRVRGLAPKTRSQVLRPVGRLLRQRLGDGCVDMASIKPAHVRRFYAQQAKLHC